MDVYVYAVLEGLAEIFPKLVRALTFTPTFPQINLFTALLTGVEVSAP